MLAVSESYLRVVSVSTYYRKERCLDGPDIHIHVSINQAMIRFRPGGT